MKRLWWMPVIGLGCGQPNHKEPESSPETEEVTGECLAPTSRSAVSGTVWSPPSEASEPVQLELELDIDASLAAIDAEGFQPRPSAVSVSGDTTGWDVVAAAKTIRAEDDTIRLELYLSPLETGLSDLVLTIDETSSDFVRDFRVDPWAAPTDARTFHQAHVNKEGFATFVFGLEHTDQISLTLTVDGLQSSAQARSSGTIDITRDDQTVWTVFPDGDQVMAVSVDTAAVEVIDIPGRPTSLALSSDDAYALVTSAHCNQVVVIDTKQHEVVQVFGEEQGVGREPRHLVVSPDGRRVYISSYVGDHITVLERMEEGFRVVDTIPTGRRPVGMSVSPDGAQLFVAHFLPRGPIATNEGWMSVWDTQTLSRVHEVRFVDQFNIDPAACIQDIEIFSTWQAEDLSFEGVPKMLAGVFLHPSGQYGLLPGLKSPGFPALEGDLSAWGITQTRKGANNPAVLYPVTFARSPLGEVLPWQMAQDVTDTTVDFLQCAKPTNDIEYVSPRYAYELGSDRDELYFYPGTVTPGAQTPFNPMGAVRALGYSRGGRRIFVLSHVADMISILDGSTFEPISLDHFTLSGSNPTGIVFAHDGARAYVSYDNSTYLSVLDTSAYAGDTLPAPPFVPYWLQETSQVTVSLATRETLTRDSTQIAEAPAITELAPLSLTDTDPMDPVMRRGKILFTSSNPEKYPGLSGHVHASCTSCHPDGASDGSAWGTVEGERRSNSLRGGTSGRGWLHYSATHANLEEFLDVVLPERLGGQGLEPSDLHALSLYIAEGIPTLQSPVTDPKLVAQGEAIFATSCAGCHMGAALSSGNPADSDPYGGGSHELDPILFDIGTQTDRAGIILGPPFAAIFPEPAGSLLLLLAGDRDLGEDDIVEEILAFEPRPTRPAGLFKAPTLVNIWDEALLLHDGRFTTLDEVVAYKSDYFGFSLTNTEKDALVEYLRSL